MFWNARKHGGLAVATNRGTFKPGKRAAVLLNSCPASSTERAATKKTAKPQPQATGGARDRKASRGESASGRATLKQCSTVSKFAGTSNWGGAGANALDARKIDAQIAQ